MRMCSVLKWEDDWAVVAQPQASCLATETLLSWAAEGRTRQDYTLLDQSWLVPWGWEGKQEKISASLNAHRPINWELVFILKFLHSHVYTEETGSISLLPHLGIWPSEVWPLRQDKIPKLTAPLCTQLCTTSLSHEQFFCVPILGLQRNLPSLACSRNRTKWLGEAQFCKNKCYEIECMWQNSSTPIGE